MAQHDGILDNAAGAAFRADLNNFLLAILSNSSGATAPSTTYAYQFWADTTTGLLKQRNAANSAWIVIGTLASAYLGLLNNNISATQRLLGRNSVGAGVAEEVTLSQLLDWIGAAAQGDVLYRGATGWERLAAGTSGYFLKTQGASANPVWATSGGDVALLEDQKPSGTNGGDFNSGAWRTRDLNTEVYDANGIVSVALNQFTLGAGTYLIEWSAPAYACGNHQTRLYNVTAVASAKMGTSENTYTTTGAEQTRSFGSYRAVLAGSTVFEIQHQCASTRLTSGLGTANTFGGEVYTQVKITKMA